jgi:hypothetical protein
MERVINVQDGLRMQSCEVSILNIFVLDIISERQIMNLSFIKKENFPTCYKCNKEMLQVSKQGENTYYLCLTKGCYHKEFSV